MKKDGRWVTLDNGTHLFIEKGETLDSAIDKLDKTSTDNNKKKKYTDKFGQKYIHKGKDEYGLNVLKMLNDDGTEKDGIASERHIQDEDMSKFEEANDEFDSGYEELDDDNKKLGTDFEDDDDYEDDSPDGELTEEDNNAIDYMLENTVDVGDYDNADDLADDVLRKMGIYYSSYQDLARHKPEKIRDYIREKFEDARDFDSGDKDNEFDSDDYESEMKKYKKWLHDNTYNYYNKEGQLAEFHKNKDGKFTNGGSLVFDTEKEMNDYLNKYGYSRNKDGGEFDPDDEGDIISEMEDEGIDTHNIQDVAEYLGATAGYDHEDQISILNGMFGKKKTKKFFSGNEDAGFGEDINGKFNENKKISNSEGNGIPSNSFINSKNRSERISRNLSHLDGPAWLLGNGDAFKGNPYEDHEFLLSRINKDIGIDKNETLDKWNAIAVRKDYSGKNKIELPKSKPTAQQIEGLKDFISGLENGSRIVVGENNGKPVSFVIDGNSEKEIINYINSYYRKK